MKCMLMAQMLLLSSMAFGGDQPASCEVASKSIASRAPSRLAQVSNLGDIEIRCGVPPRPFPTKPGENRMGLKVASTAYKISPDGSKAPVSSGVQLHGGGFDSKLEFVDFTVHIPLDAIELDAEVRRSTTKLEQWIESTTPGQVTEELHQQVMKSFREFICQHRVGHFQVECRVLDGDRVIGVGAVEFEVLFKGRFSDVGLLGIPPA